MNTNDEFAAQKHSDSQALLQSLKAGAASASSR